MDFRRFQCISVRFGVVWGVWVVLSLYLWVPGKFPGFPYFWAGFGPLSAVPASRWGWRIKQRTPPPPPHTHGRTSILVHFGIFLRILVYFWYIFVYFSAFGIIFR